jgi:Flp pilus assembly protein protease CpaA
MDIKLLNVMVLALRFCDALYIAIYGLMVPATVLFSILKFGVLWFFVEHLDWCGC